MLASAVGIVMASNGNGKEMARVIADTTGIIDKLSFRVRGCEIIHELSDATALKCPANIVSKLKVREDPVLHIMDMEANVQINADDVWTLGYTGSGVTVAVLDTGIDTDHPELADSIAGGQGFGYLTYEDDHGHGTHVSGIITADGVGGTPFGFAKGAAPDTKIWMAKVCNASGSCYSTDIAAAIEYVVSNNIAKIMSISLGGGGTSRANCDTDYLAKKVNWAVDNGVTVAVAAGNTSGRVSSPGCASKAIAVGAVDKSDVRASFSGTGLALDIMAPGVNIYSSIIGGYDSWSGTSMATPHISATIALLKQVNSALADNQIKDALYKTAKDLGTAGWDKYYGWGRVDALAAVNYVKPPEPECTGDADCDDELFCNGPETCSAGVCQPGAPIDCSDGISCTVDTCDEIGDTCVHTPSDSLCNDGLYCNGVEYCDATLDCQVGTPVICEDDNECTIDNCNETADACEYSPVENNTSCASGEGVCCLGECKIGLTECPVTAVKCWSGSNQYLYRNNGQAAKFCKCASGTYGYNSYNYTWARKTVFYYVDSGNNENWEAASRSSYLPVYQVTCTNGKAYLTDQDYYYPK